MNVGELVDILKKCDQKVKVYGRYTEDIEISEGSWDSTEHDVDIEPKNVFDMDSHVIIELLRF